MVIAGCSWEELAHSWLWRAVAYSRLFVILRTNFYLLDISDQFENGNEILWLLYKWLYMIFLVPFCALLRFTIRFYNLKMFFFQAGVEICNPKLFFLICLILLKFENKFIYTLFKTKNFPKCWKRNKIFCKLVFKLFSFLPTYITKWINVSNWCPMYIFTT